MPPPKFASHKDRPPYPTGRRAVKANLKNACPDAEEIRLMLCRNITEFTQFHWTNSPWIPHTEMKTLAGDTP
jgi:hypothetical protein